MATDKQARVTPRCDLTTTYRDGHEAVWCRTCGAEAKVEPEFGETLVCRLRPTEGVKSMNVNAGPPLKIVFFVTPDGRLTISDELSKDEATQEIVAMLVEQWKHAGGAALLEKAHRERCKEEERK